jgi:hypothetical protein
MPARRPTLDPNVRNDGGAEIRMGIRPFAPPLEHITMSEKI